jgi:Na+/proline symporter
MPAELVETAAEGAIGLSLIVWVALILFWFASPIVGFFVFKATRRNLPTSSTLALVGMAVCGFLFVFALTLLLLLQVTDGTTALLVSTGSALVVTALCAFVISRWFARGKVKAQAHADEQAFRVWDEDRRSKDKPKNLRKRRY